MKMKQLSTGVGRGLLAGLVGTVAMTISSTTEQHLRKRRPSSAPGDAAARVLGIDNFVSKEAERNFATLVHWGYGTGWGVARGVFGALGLHPLAASGAQFIALWGGEQVMLPALEVAPPVTMWERKEVAIDAWHHIVYVVATGLAYQWLDSRADGR